MVARLEGDYDYIIVGAGTAGCLLANRLSARADRRVLLLEAGGGDDWIWLHIPVGYIFAIGNPRCDWMFRTQSEPGLNSRSIAYPRGRVLGGSSAINAMICMRGQAADYDGWRALGLPGWGWSDVLPAFKRLEDHFLGSTEYHGTGGGLRVEAPRIAWPVLDAVRRAAVELGLRAIDDFNCGDNEGVSYFHVNQKRGRRWSAARGFLKPALARGNLRLESRALVERLIIQGGRACGVQFRRDGSQFEARAAGEVVLCAGAIGSPQVLSLSGIGRHQWLTALGIATVLDLPGVGSNLQDHLQLRAIYRVSNIRTLNTSYHSLLARAWMGLDYALRRRGPLTMAPSQLGIFMRSDPTYAHANLQFHVQPMSLDKFGDPLHSFPAITVSACNLRPSSRGTVRPGSADPSAAPLIAPNYLSTQAGSPRGGRCHSRHPTADDSTRRQGLLPVRIPPRPGRWRRHALAGARRGRYRHHDIPSGGYSENGSGRGPGRSGGRTAAGARDRAPQGDRRVGHASDHVRQYQYPDGDDCREGSRDDARRLPVTVRG